MKGAIADLFIRLALTTGLVLCSPLVLVGCVFVVSVAMLQALWKVWN